MVSIKTRRYFLQNLKMQVSYIPQVSFKTQLHAQYRQFILYRLRLYFKQKTDKNHHTCLHLLSNDVEILKYVSVRCMLSTRRDINCTNIEWIWSWVENWTLNEHQSFKERRLVKIVFFARSFYLCVLFSLYFISCVICVCKHRTEHFRKQNQRRKV